MNTSPSPKQFPSEVQAPRTKLIKWKINDCLRHIKKKEYYKVSTLGDYLRSCCAMELLRFVPDIRDFFFI